MRCPYCGQADSRVIDSRAADEGTTIRRRRECSGCGRRFTTYEVVEKVPLMVIKNDGRREPFNSEKLLNGLIRSCEKRDIPMEKIVNLSHEIERDVRNTMEREIPLHHGARRASRFEKAYQISLPAGGLFIHFCPLEVMGVRDFWTGNSRKS